MAASPFLKRLWEREPFKSRWAIIGRAYTAVRDVSSKQALPLSVFLQTAAPLMGIIPLTDYLPMMGWELSYTSKGTVELSLASEPILRNFPPSASGTAMTEHDLIRFCHSGKATFSSEMVSEALSLLSARSPQQALLAVADCTSQTTPTISFHEQHRQERRQKVKRKRRLKTCNDILTHQDAVGGLETTFQLPWSGSMADLRLPAVEQSTAALCLDDYLGLPTIEQPHGFELDSFFAETWCLANNNLQ